MSEDEMAGWYHRGNEHELGQTLRDDEGQRGLVCYSPWGCKEPDTTGQLNNNINVIPWYGSNHTNNLFIQLLVDVHLDCL